MGFFPNQTMPNYYVAKHAQKKKHTKSTLTKKVDPRSFTVRPWKVTETL